MLLKDVPFELLEQIVTKSCNCFIKLSVYPSKDEDGVEMMYCIVVTLDDLDFYSIPQDRDSEYLKHMLFRLSLIRCENNSYPF